MYESDIPLYIICKLYELNDNGFDMILLVLAKLF